MVYADAYNNQLNDRYAGKRDQFHSMASWAYDKLVRIGTGVVLDPISRAVEYASSYRVTAGSEDIPWGWDLRPEERELVPDEGIIHSWR